MSGCCEEKSLDNSPSGGLGGGGDVDFNDLTTTTLTVLGTNTTNTLAVTGSSILNTLSVTGAMNALDLTASGLLKTTLTTDASNLNTGALICLGGASISKKIYMGDTLYTNWGGTALNRSSIVCSPGTNGTESSIRFTQNINDTGALWVVGHNVDNSGVNTLAFYSSTFNSWVARFENNANFTVKGVIKTDSTSEATGLNTGALISVGGASISKKLYVGGILNCNWGQGVPNGSSALTISPTVQAGQASLSFSTDLNQTGGIFTLGQNVNSQGDGVFGLFYSASSLNLFTCNGASGVMTVPTSITTPIITTSTINSTQGTWNNTGFNTTINIGTASTGNLSINGTYNAGPTWCRLNRSNIRVFDFGWQASTTYQHIFFYAGLTGANTGNITDNGSNVTYNTSSDYRVKTNIVPLSNSLSRIVTLNPINYNYTNGSQAYGEGFLAHEVQTVVPTAVQGQKDAVDEEGKMILQGVDYGLLTPLLVGGVKELVALVQQLNDRLLVLEGQ
jgi:hypothetical protein